MGFANLDRIKLDMVVRIPVCKLFWEGGGGGNVAGMEQGIFKL